MTESDLANVEFNLLFDANSRYETFEVEVADDDLSEREEWFILYLNITHNRCALAVSIHDNDGKCSLMTHSSSIEFVTMLILICSIKF